MTKHFQKEMEALRRKLLALVAVVEGHLHDAIAAVERRDAALAGHVIARDTDIDRAEVDLEEDCLKLLALYQPVANDLRFIIAVLKINNDLERIGDLAVNIAERAAFLATQQRVPVPFDFRGMAAKTQEMIRKSLDALVDMDADLARQVCAMDDEVDMINREMYDQVKEGIRRNPEHIESLIHMLSVSRHIERVADLATNIAEDVIYRVEGEIVRHRTEDYSSHEGKAEEGGLPSDKREERE